MTDTRTCAERGHRQRRVVVVEGQRITECEGCGAHLGAVNGPLLPATGVAAGVGWWRNAPRGVASSA